MVPVIIVIYSKFSIKFAQVPLSFTSEKSFKFFSSKENIHKVPVIFYQIFKARSGSVFQKQLDPDSRGEKLMDPDLQKINANPQPCL